MGEMIVMFKSGGDDTGSGRKRFWTSSRMKILLVLVIGIAIGLLAQHYLVEPLLEKTAQEQFIECKKENRVLNEEINSCLIEKQNCENALKEIVGS